MRTISRVFIIGNGVPGAENQCFGLVRALGLSHRQTLFRVIRPKGGFNKRLQFLPVSLHKRVENVRKLIYGDSLPTQIAVRGHKLMSLAAERQVSSDILEANAKHIAALSCEAFAKTAVWKEKLWSGTDLLMMNNDANSFFGIPGNSSDLFL
ncbi:hypothetical protein H5410_044396 [Solanum commersonii]|uniref:Uncharacterized protein n=1 Tax=Solanum commersonii TaxID=4109 RepID=A0A9J5X7Y4_SOLCO|nr:hypothetical protein H5410_044396 [Solanum commersonii]